MAKQLITWTTLPGGVRTDTRGGVRFTLHVAPRLQTTGAADATLDQQFPDFVDWPATLTGMTAELAFPDLGVSFAASPDPEPGAAPDSAKWSALFQQTLVRNHGVPNLTGIKMPSYPVGHIVDFLAEQWGKVGATSPEDYPSFDDLIGPFRDIGFLDLDAREESKSGWHRLDDLRGELEERYTKDGGVVRYDPNDANTATGRGLTFLQLLDFHNRGPKMGSGIPPIKVRQKLDFHQAVALTANHRALQRMLGLVLQFTAPSTSDLRLLLSGPAQDTWCTVRLSVPNLDGAMSTSVIALVRCTIGDQRFEATPRPSSELTSGMLRVGESSRFGVFTVDPDGGALKTMQFAATLTRSHVLYGTDWRQRSLGTAEVYPLPALRTGGISVARLGNAYLTFTKLKSLQALNTDVYEPPAGSEPEELRLYADDIVRGFRWDVQDTADGLWRTLMERDGHYKLLRLPADQQQVPVREEAAVVKAMTTADTESKDLYLQESLVSWSGWSLAVARPSSAVGLEGQVGPAETEVEADYQFDSHFDVPPGTLPRLRFGHTYSFRARAVDLGNDGHDPSEQGLPGGSDAIAKGHQFLRFEPVEAPTVALRKPRWPGESPAHVAVRTDHERSERHVVPPRTSQLMAEWHGVLDKPADGQPDPAFYATLAERDATRLEDALDPNQTWDPHQNPAYYDVNVLPVPYLPDVLARNAVIRGLPPTPNGVARVPLIDVAWPDAMSFRIVLDTAAVGGALWERVGQELRVALEPGDMYQLKISCQFDPDDLDVMALWDWIKAWNATQPPAQQVDLAAVRSAIVRGYHWMFTPWRPTMLIHAVRTPLSKPTWTDVSVGRELGSTSARISDRLFTFSQKSSGTIDVVGSWRMPIDNGPGTSPNPTVNQDFRSTAYTVNIDHPIGPAPDVVQMYLNGDHEFGDHKFRRIAYRPVATSPFVEYFREGQVITLTGVGAPFDGDVAIESIKVRHAIENGQYYESAARGELDPATATGDFIVDSDNHVIRRTANSKIPANTQVELSFARGPITLTGDAEERNVPNSARPAVPKVLYVVPTFKWETIPDGSRRLGGGLRVYLERPWWSSGDGERLGVVLWPTTAEPPEAVRPYVTGWAPDPVTVSTAIGKDGPDVTSFPLKDVSVTGAGVTLAEVSDTHVHVAAHTVAFDAERDLWYCDLRVTYSGINEVGSYFPYVRLALARYQHNSLPDCHLSKVVLAEYIQLANSRSATIVTNWITRHVTVTGRGFTDNSSGYRSQLRAFVERRTTIEDPELGWEQVGTAHAFTATVSAGNHFTWTASVPGPLVRGTYRLRIEEYERLRTGDPPALFIHPTADRVVYTEILPFS